MMLIVFIAIYSAQNAILKKPTELFFWNIEDIPNKFELCVYFEDVSLQKKTIKTKQFGSL